MGKQYSFEIFRDRSLHLFLFQNVSNSEELLQKLRNLELEMALMNTENVE